MAFDLNAYRQKWGMKGYLGTGSQDTSYTTKSGQAAKPSSGVGAFASNVATSAAKIGGGVVGGALSGYAKDLKTVAAGITQGLPGVGQIAQNQRSFNQRSSDISRAQELFTKQYKQGKISRERYTSLLKDLNKDQQSVNTVLQDEAKNYTKPADYLKSLAVVGSTPLAAGRLTAAPKISAATQLAAVKAGVTGQQLASGVKGVNSLKAIAAAGAPRLGFAEKQVSKLPNVTLNETSRSMLGSAAIAPLKTGLMYAPSAEAATQIPGQIEKGDYKGAGINAAILGSPLAIGAVAKNLPKVTKAVGNAFYGKKSFLDNIPTKDGKITGFLKTLDGPEAEKYTTIAKRFQEHNLGESKRDVGLAIDKYINWVGKDKAKSMSSKEHLDLFSQFTDDIARVREAARSGSLPKPDGGRWTEKEIRNLWVGRFDQSAKSRLVNKLKDISDPGERSAAAARLAENEQWGANTILKDQVIAAAERTDFDKAINKITGTRSLSAPTAQQVKVANIQKGQKPVGEGQKVLDNLFGKAKPLELNEGHIPILRSNVKNQIPKNVDNVKIEEGKDAAPILKTLGAMAEKMGIGTRSHNAQTYRHYRANLDTNLKELGLDPKEVYDSLKTYTRNKMGVFDERQLTPTQLKEALKLKSTTEANQVRKAMVDAYTKLTWGDLGVAGKIENALYKSSLYGRYRRIQGVLKYEKNPFFGAQTAVEAELLSQNVAKGKSLHTPGTVIWKRMFKAKSYNELDNIANDAMGLLDNPSILGEGYTAAGAADNAFGPITAKLTQNQKQSIGGLIKTLAQRNGQTPTEFLKTADPKVLDSIRSVVQYPREGFLASNFAKTLNMFVFPSRYTMKLTGITGKALADMPPLLQVGTLKGISDFNQFLNSDEGIKWQSDNSEILGIIKYLNPLNNIQQIMDNFRKGEISISDFGIIGGLPLGVVTQALKTQTGIGAGTAYQNPKTGEIYPDKMPADLQGAAKLLLTDVINSMYSYSGRSFGLPVSKNDITETVSGKLLKTSKGQTKTIDKPPTPYQERVQRVLGTQSEKKKNDEIKRTAASAKVQFSKPTPVITPIYKDKKAKAKKTKPKAFRPRPL